MSFTFNFSLDKLRRIIPGNPNVESWHNSLSQILPTYEINSQLRVAAFLAQCGHESNNFRSLRENLNYRAESLMRVWPRHFPNLTVARQYAHNQPAIANRAYANRMGNGKEESGDGWKFSGRGLIQLTGRSNYQAFADSIKRNIEEMPEYLVTINGAVHSACWFWKTNNLNKWADVKDMVTLTKRINGGTIGLEDRLKHYKHALDVLNS
jgi:putative chitinase